MGWWAPFLIIMQFNFHPPTLPKNNFIYIFFKSTPFLKIISLFSLKKEKSKKKKKKKDKTISPFTLQPIHFFVRGTIIWLVGEFHFHDDLIFCFLYLTLCL